MINHYSGGAVVAPWTVALLDEASLDTFIALHEFHAKRPNLNENIKAVEDFKSRYRRQFIKH